MNGGIKVPNTIAGWAIWLVILLAIVACVVVATQAMGVAIPGWIITLFLICVAAAVIVAAIRFLAGLGGSGVTAIQLPNTIAGWAIWLVILLAIIACVYVAITTFGIPIPQWVITLGIILLVAAAVILAIRFLASLGGGGGPRSPGAP